MGNVGTDETVNGHKPLEGIRILEYGIFHAGPGATAILGDLGAEVIKIETKEGDPERIWTNIGAFDFKLPHDRSLMYDISNRSKRGITLDIKTDRGKEIFYKLLKNADVFMTNLRKSTKTRLGIDYETLSKEYPKLIHANVSGYGPDGPFADIGAFDPLGQARSGMMFIAGTTEPSLIHLAVLDQATAIAASHAILTALLVRERKGIGQEIHTSLYSTALWLMYANIMATSQKGVDAVIPWDRFHNTPLRNNFCSKDGKWFIGVHHPPEKYWETLCRATGMEYLINDPRFCDEEQRTRNCPELVGLFDEVFVTKTLDEWMEIFRKNFLMFSPIQRFKDILKDKQALDNDYIVDFEHPDFGTIKMPGYPVHFSKTPARTTIAAPTLGQHTDEVLEEIGYNKQEIEQLRKDMII